MTDIGFDPTDTDSLAYAEHWARHQAASGMCASCWENDALPNRDLCYGCSIDAGLVHVGVDPADENDSWWTV